MPKLIKDGAIANDEWVLIESAEVEGALPSGNLIVPLALWAAQQEQLLARDEEVGVWLQSDESPDKIGDRLRELALVAINFPAFTDGRGFSYAQLLRSRLNFTGELRAIGDVGKDQMFFMQRCGFDSYLIADDKDTDQAIAALSSFTDTYQSAQDRPVPAFRRNA